MNAVIAMVIVLSLFGGFAAGSTYMNDVWSFDCQYQGSHGNNRDGVIYHCYPAEPAKAPRPNPKRTRA